jgi:DDE superfamily endonuclease
MTTEPYASAERVFWVVDNGSSHRGQIAIDRLAEQYPNAIMVHTPVHASWLNQIEIYFSIVQRKALSPNEFTDIDAVSDRLSAFETRYNQTAQPFKWKFTTTDLTELLARLDNHKPEPNHDLHLPALDHGRSPTRDPQDRQLRQTPIIRSGACRRSPHRGEQNA